MTTNRNTNVFSQSVVYNDPPYQLFRTQESHAMLFTQAVASDEWVIEHNMGFVPTITIDVDGIADRVWTDIIDVTKNKSIVRFSIPYTGKARIK